MGRRRVSAIIMLQRHEEAVETRPTSRTFYTSSAAFSIVGQYDRELFSHDRMPQELHSCDGVGWINFERHNVNTIP